MKQVSQNQLAAKEALPTWLTLVFEKVQTLQFGSVLITVHDGKVTQIECAEKVRLRPEPLSRSGS